MATAALAQDYARALFEKAVDKYLNDLHALNNALLKNGLVTRLDNPGEPFDSKKALLSGILPPNIEPEIRNLAYLLADKNQVHLLEQVVGEFDRIVSQGAPGATAIVTTAIELTTDDRAKLEAKLHKQFGDELRIEYRLDPAIVGGVVVRVGDIVIDGSVTAKLAALKQKLASAA